MTPTTELTPRQARAIEAILTTSTREAAARQAGVSDRTLRRWQNVDAFAAEVRRQRTRLLDGVSSILTAGAGSCARALVEIATAGGTPRDAVRVSAARAVLDLASRFEEQGTLTVRLAELEAALAVQSNPLPVRGYSQ